MFSYVITTRWSNKKNTMSSQYYYHILNPHFIFTEYSNNSLLDCPALLPRPIQNPTQDPEFHLVNTLLSFNLEAFLGFSLSSLKCMDQLFWKRSLSLGLSDVSMCSFVSIMLIFGKAMAFSSDTSYNTAPSLRVLWTHGRGLWRKPIQVSCIPGSWFHDARWPSFYGCWVFKGRETL